MDQPLEQELAVLRRRVAELEELENTNRLLQQERNMFITGSVVVFKWRNLEGWPVEYVSHNVFDVLGYSVDDLVSGRLPYARIISPEDIARVTEEVGSNSESGAASFEHQPYRIVREDGTTIWVADFTTILRDESGRVTHYLGYIVDISDRMRVEEALRESQMRWRQVIDLVPHFIFAKDRAGRFLMANRTLAEAYGTNVEELLGKTDSDFVRSPEEVAQLRADDLEVIDSGRPKVIPEERITDAAGEVRILQTTKIPFTWTGTERAVLGVATHITELRRAEQQRRRLETQVLQAQKLESLGVLAGGVAHDFNNYLTAILGNSALLLLKLPTDSAFLPMLQAIEKAAQHAAEVANQLLTFTGKGESETRLFDLDELVEEMAHLLKISIPKRIRLERHLARDLPAIQGDPNQIRQVVMNLILNAADAVGDDAGEITLTTSVRSVDRAYLVRTYLGEDLPEGRYVVLEVSDTGCGMDETTRDRLFDPFFTTKPDGRGLGMASVLGTVRGHRGAIKVDSEPGRGSTLRVHFAAADGAEAAPRAAPATDDRQGTGTILVVDDDPTIRTLARDILEELGYTVLDAEDGLHALEVFRQQVDRISAVLLDMTMPRLDGTGTFRELHRIRPGVRVLLSTGFSEQQGAVKRLIRKGRTDLLRKPYHPIALVEKLTELLKD